MSDERTKFEAWMAAKYPAVRLTRRTDGEYWSNAPDTFWEGWQARAALAQAEPGQQASASADDFSGVRPPMRRISGVSEEVIKRAASPSAGTDAEQLQGGMDNNELREAWSRKLPGVIPTDREMTAFALGVEVGDESRMVYFNERNSARDAWRRRVKQCEQLEAEVAALRSAAPAPTEPDGGAKMLQAIRQAAAALHRHAMLPWGQPGYPTPTPGAHLLYEAQSYLDAALARVQAELAAPTVKDAMDRWAKNVADGTCESPVVIYEPQRLEWDEHPAAAPTHEGQPNKGGAA